MKKLLSLLSVLTISGTAVPTTIAASSYQKEEKLNSYINYSETNNLEILNRSKRDVWSDIGNFFINNAPNNIGPRNHFGGDEYNNLGKKIKDQCFKNPDVLKDMGIYAAGGAATGASGGFISAAGGAVVGAISPCISKIDINGAYNN